MLWYSQLQDVPAIQWVILRTPFGERKLFVDGSSLRYTQLAVASNLGSTKCRFVKNYSTSHLMCYPNGFLSISSYNCYSCKYGITFHLRLYVQVVLTRGDIIFYKQQVQSLCSACDCAFKHSLPLGLAFQRSRFLQHYTFVHTFLHGEAILSVCNF